MGKTILESPEVARPAPGQIMSQGVKVPAGNLIFVSGQVARNSRGEVVGRGDIKAQTHQVIGNIRSVLEAAGATLEDVVKVTVFVTSVEHLSQIHEVRAQYFEKDYPASTLVEVSALANPDFLIEIEAISVTP